MQATQELSLADEVTLASQQNTPEAGLRLFQRLEGSEVYYPIQLGESSAATAAADTIAALPLLMLPSGQKALRVFVDREDQRLTRPFGGAIWQHVLLMFAGTPEADGLLVTNRRGDTVAWDRAAVSRLAASVTPLPPSGETSRAIKTPHV